MEQRRAEFLFPCAKVPPQATSNGLEICVCPASMQIAVDSGRDHLRVHDLESQNGDSFTDPTANPSPPSLMQLVCLEAAFPILRKAVGVVLHASVWNMFSLYSVLGIRFLFPVTEGHFCAC